MNNKYINGMNEVKADDNLKRKIINNIEENNFSESAFAQPSHLFTFKKAVAVIAFVCTFAFVMTLGLPNFKNNNTKNVPKLGVKKAFHDFVITAYAADGTTFNIKPNVEFSLGKYQMTMSSVPGFPLKIVCKDADTIKLTATDGEFLLWAPPNFKVQNKGKELEIKSGDTLYWSPQKSSNSNTAASNSTILIKAYKGKKEIGTNSIKIQSDNTYSYVGKLSE